MGENNLLTVQCMNGHVYNVHADSELGERATKYAETHLDALPIPPQDCDDCKEELERRKRLAAEMDMSWLEAELGADTLDQLFGD